jgi:ATP-dependent protease Clp ATPase subunit
VGFRDWLGWRKKEPPKLADLHCTFCGKSGVEAKKIIAGPRYVYNICDGCIGSLCEPAAREEMRLAALFHDACSFCGKTRRRVLWLVGDEKAAICHGCHGLCRDILEEERG